MAQKVHTQYTDDIDGTDAVTTVSFSLQGRDYEIDLHAGHLAELEQDFSRWVGHAREVKRVRSRAKIRTRSSRERSALIRQYARQHGLKVAERGRIPASVIAQYEASLTR